MRLVVENFAKIKHADLEFDGITVLAGKNNTGKSTIGKIVFALFFSMYRMGNKILNERKAEVLGNFRLLLENVLKTYADNTIKYQQGRPPRQSDKFFSIMMDPQINTKDEFLRQLYAFAKNVSGLDIKKLDINYEELEKKADAIWNIPDEKMAQGIMEEVFKEIFTYQINSILQPDTCAKARMTIKQHDISIDFRDNECIFFHSDVEIANHVIYIDDPFLIDHVMKQGMSSTIQQRCIAYLEENRPPTIASKLLAEEKLSKVYDMLGSVISGKLIMREDSNGLFLQQQGLAEELNVTNLSAGLKSFAILKRLLENGTLRERDVLILDEPEIHLHPEWQLRYAELIVLLQKTFDLTILLTTHSPFFLDAIEIFSAKHEIADKLHYYLSKQGEHSVAFENVTNHIDRIYEQMSEPIQLLENMRSELQMGR